MKRQQQLTDWLRHLFPNERFSIAPASADASFRRYFRVTFQDGGDTRIAMDAPPQHEDCRPFLHIGKLFEDAGTHVPHVYAQDLEQGFLLLSDLGNTTYLQALGPDNARTLYDAATDALVRIQLASRPDELPPYDAALLRRELDLFPEWYIARHLQITLGAAQSAALDAVFQRILDSNLAQPRVYVHRDYHSRNLMVSEPNPGILDFQDAVYGPITYDLVSLFKDAYVRWDEAQVLDWLIRYWEKARRAGLPVHDAFGEFYRDYEWMGVQRHIKVLGIFARLYHRDGKDGYLQDLPLVMDYLRRACERYIELKPLLNLLDELEPRGPKVGYTF
jgi:aminoglycoside/choline kinase family phosphotransferase